MGGIEGPKSCEEHEFEATLDLLNFVFRSSRGRPPDLGQSFAHFYRESNRKNLHIIKVHGKVISHAGIFPAQVAIGEKDLKVGAIGGVGTHPDYRGRGYASLLLRDCVNKMEREDFDLSILWSSEIPDFYRRLGWEKAGYENTYSLDQSDIALLPPLTDAEFQEGCEGHLDEIHRLHCAEPLRVVRTEEIMAILLGRPGVETFLALQNGVPVAYIVFREERIDDYAGQAKAVVGLIREVFERRELSRLFVLTPRLDAGLPRMLEELGIARQQGCAGMMRVIDLGNLLGKLGLADLGFRRKGEQFVLEREGRTAEVSLRQLSKLLFGPERISDFGRDLFPIRFYWGRLDHV